MARGSRASCGSSDVPACWRPERGARGPSIRRRIDWSNSTFPCSGAYVIDLLRSIFQTVSPRTLVNKGGTEAFRTPSPRGRSRACAPYYCPSSAAWQVTAPLYLQFFSACSCETKAADGGVTLYMLVSSYGSVFRSYNSLAPPSYSMYFLSVVRIP